ncbi:hypothetical protein BDW75DRAFT_204713 [Aspergillus navahoensis]
MKRIKRGIKSWYTFQRHLRRVSVVYLFGIALSQTGGFWSKREREGRGERGERAVTQRGAAEHRKNIGKTPDAAVAFPPSAKRIHIKREVKWMHEVTRKEVDNKQKAAK